MRIQIEHGRKVTKNVDVHRQSGFALDCGAKLIADLTRTARSASAGWEKRSCRLLNQFAAETVEILTDEARSRFVKRAANVTPVLYIRGRDPKMITDSLTSSGKGKVFANLDLR